MHKMHLLMDRIVSKPRRSAFNPDDDLADEAF